jgi:hypothetical protein
MQHVDADGRSRTVDVTHRIADRGIRGAIAGTDR